MTASSTEIEAIETTVQKYIDGVAKGDPGLIEEAFHPDATMSGHFGGKFAISPASSRLTNFMKTLPPTSVHSPNFNGRILDVRCDGTLAAATIAEDRLMGKNFITHFHLHKVDGVWRISAKATFAM